jgi:hypothetical protein
MATVEEYCIMENMELREALANKEQENLLLIIKVRELEKIIQRQDSAIIWCGASCFEDMGGKRYKDGVEIVDLTHEE